MGERVDLTGALEGRHIMVDVDGLTIGVLVKLESNRITEVMAAVNSLVVGGDVGDLLALKPIEFQEIIAGLMGALNGPKKAT